MNFMQKGPFAMIQGMIVDMVPARDRDGRPNGCELYFTVEDESGNVVTFLVTKDTYVLDCMTLKEGMDTAFWYRTDAPAPLIYPPQYRAVVAAVMGNERAVDVSFYDDALVNAEHSLQLNLDRSVTMRTTNHQIYMGSPANHDLVVTYTSSTRIIPAQTTPMQIVVLCGDDEQG